MPFTKKTKSVERQKINRRPDGDQMAGFYSHPYITRNRVRRMQSASRLARINSFNCNRPLVNETTSGSSTHFHENIVENSTSRIARKRSASSQSFSRDNVKRPRLFYYTNSEINFSFCSIDQDLLEILRAPSTASLDTITDEEDIEDIDDEDDDGKENQHFSSEQNIPSTNAPSNDLNLRAVDSFSTQTTMLNEELKVLSLLANNDEQIDIFAGGDGPHNDLLNAGNNMIDVDVNMIRVEDNTASTALNEDSDKNKITDEDEVDGYGPTHRFE